MTTDDRESRLARNQMLFREVNERLQDVNSAFDIALPVGDWICECANDQCTKRLPMTLDEYDAIRMHGSRFPVAPEEAHVYPDVEDVVERNDRYWVVAKRGAAATLAETANPRSRGASS